MTKLTDSVSHYMQEIPAEVRCPICTTIISTSATSSILDHLHDSACTGAYIAQLPEGWIMDVLYLNSCAICDDFHLLDDHFTLNAPQCWGNVRIQQIHNGPIAVSAAPHPAYGVFATAPIAANTLVGTVTGVYHRGYQRTIEPIYKFETRLDDEVIGPYYINVTARSVGNEARFINDFPGIADAPNVRVEFVTAMLPGVGLRGQYNIRSIGQINPGEQLLLDYNAGVMGGQWY